MHDVHRIHRSADLNKRGSQSTYAGCSVWTANHDLPNTSEPNYQVTSTRHSDTRASGAASRSRSSLTRPSLTGFRPPRKSAGSASDPGDLGSTSGAVSVLEILRR